MTTGAVAIQVPSGSAGCDMEEGHECIINRKNTESAGGLQDSVMTNHMSCLHPPLNAAREGERLKPQILIYQPTYYVIHVVFIIPVTNLHTILTTIYTISADSQRFLGLDISCQTLTSKIVAPPFSLTQYQSTVNVHFFFPWFSFCFPLFCVSLLLRA